MSNSSHFEDSRGERAKNRAEEKCATTTNDAPSAENFPSADRRAFLQGAAAAAAALAMPRWASAHPGDMDAIRAEIEQRHDASVKRSEEHTSELQSLRHLVCRLLLEKKNKKGITYKQNPTQTDKLV